MTPPEPARFAIGTVVRVKRLSPPGHVRTPWFTRGRTGRILAIVGTFGDPESLAYGGDGTPRRPLYRVGFTAADLWEKRADSADDTVVVDLYEHWLEAAP